MSANWSTSDWMVEASRLRSRSTPELARLRAIASPLDWNSPRICRRRVSVMTSAATTVTVSSSTPRKSRILAVSPMPRTARVGGAGCDSGDACGASAAAAVGGSSYRWAGSDMDHRAPVVDGHPGVAREPREVDLVEALVAVGSEGERSADAQVELADRFERRLEAPPARSGSRAAQPLDDHSRVDEALEADEAVRLDAVLGVAERRRQLELPLVHQAAVQVYAGQRAFGRVARHHLRVDQARGVVAPGPAPVLEQQPAHRLAADERDVADRHRPAQVARRAHEGAAGLVGAGAEHRLDAGVAQVPGRHAHVGVESGAAAVRGLGGDARAVQRQAARHAVGAAAAVGVDLVEDAEAANAGG